jgi:hypothetical protein
MAFERGVSIVVVDGPSEAYIILRWLKPWRSRECWNILQLRIIRHA